MNPAVLQALNAAVLSDTLDSLGLMQQAMRPFMRPLDDSLQLVGRARTGVYMPVYAAPALGENPYEVEIALVDDLARGDVVVLACDGPTDRIAPWGERRDHLAGALGAALLQRLYALRWAKRVEGSRAVAFTAMGEQNLRAAFPRSTP